MKHEISLNAAAALTLRYRQNKEAILAPAYQNQNILSLSETFDRAAIDALLAKPGCTALRIYYGMDENLKLHAVLVGADAANHDILPPGVGTMTDTQPTDDIVDQALMCPPACPPPSPLNKP